jgi:alkanesulfonate monooxygenase SsuD/methylene tetrahydromethanopterin reductase-like flavin-dependent oxidoreductase (luciferase family)
MQFGLFGSAQASSGKLGQGVGQGFHDYIEFNVEAEALGFHSAFLVEHHFTGWTQVSATLNLLTWLAAKTRTLRVGTAVMVLPWHNPVLLAEQAATLDLLSGGRLDFGVGKGYRANEFDGFNVPIEESEARFDEALEVIVKAWTSTERFSHKGRFWTFNDIIVEPQAAQQPHPPIWMGAGSPASIKKVAQRGCNLILDQYASPEKTGEKIALFKAECAAIGRRFDPMQVAVARDLYVAKNQADKEVALERHLESSNRTLEVARAANRKGGSHILSYDNAPGGTEAHTMYGTPDEIIAKLDAMRAAGVGYVLFNIPGGARESLRRLASEILPAFRTEPKAAAAAR